MGCSPINTCAVNQYCEPSTHLCHRCDEVCDPQNRTPFRCEKLCPDVWKKANNSNSGMTTMTNITQRNFCQTCLILNLVVIFVVIVIVIVFLVLRRRIHLKVCRRKLCNNKHEAEVEVQPTLHRAKEVSPICDDYHVSLCGNMICQETKDQSDNLISMKSIDVYWPSKVDTSLERQKAVKEATKQCTETSSLFKEDTVPKSLESENCSTQEFLEERNIANEEHLANVLQQQPQGILDDTEQVFDEMLGDSASEPPLSLHTFHEDSANCFVDLRSDPVSVNRTGCDDKTFDQVLQAYTGVGARDFEMPFIRGYEIDNGRFQVFVSDSCSLDRAANQIQNCIPVNLREGIVIVKHVSDQ